MSQLHHEDLCLRTRFTGNTLSFIIIPGLLLILLPLVRSMENLSFIFTPSELEIVYFLFCMRNQEFYPLCVCTFSCTAKKKRNGSQLLH